MYFIADALISLLIANAESFNNLSITIVYYGSY